MSLQRSWLFLIAGIGLAFPVGSRAQSTAFTYQGLLQNDGAPVDARCDFEFRLFDALSAGEEVADAKSVAALQVTRGVFTASVDFGAEAFPDEDRWLQIAVRCPAGQGELTALAPRQPVTRAPYAISAPAVARDADGNVQAELGVSEEDAGYVEIYGANGNTNILLGQFTESPNEGLIDVDGANGDPRVTTSVTTEGAGFVETYSQDGDVNVLVGHLSGYPDHGFVGVYEKGEIRAGMYVTDDDVGMVFGDESDFVSDYEDEPGQKIVYASVQGPEAAIYHRGTAKLAEGRGTIELPAHFTALASPGTLTVQLTPHSLASLGVAVGEIDGGRIEIGELQGGKGSYDVYYVVHAVRRGHENRKAVFTDEEFRRTFHPVAERGRRARKNLQMAQRESAPRGGTTRPGLVPVAHRIGRK